MSDDYLLRSPVSTVINRMQQEVPDYLLMKYLCHRIQLHTTPPHCNSSRMLVLAWYEPPSGRFFFRGHLESTLS